MNKLVAAVILAAVLPLLAVGLLVPPPVEARPWCPDICTFEPDGTLVCFDCEWDTTLKQCVCY